MIDLILVMMFIPYGMDFDIIVYQDYEPIREPHDELSVRVNVFDSRINKDYGAGYPFGFINKANVTTTMGDITASCLTDKRGYCSNVIDMPMGYQGNKVYDLLTTVTYDGKTYNMTGSVYYNGEL